MPRVAKRPSPRLSKTNAPRFFIDARFLLRNTTETFWSAPLIVVDGKDNTFGFGFMRDVLRIRQALRVLGGAIVLGSEAASCASKENIQLAVDLAAKLGMVVIEEPKVPVMSLLAACADRFSNIVTDDRRMLQFATEHCTVHLGKDTRSLEPKTPDAVQRSLGVSVDHVPTYLALTEKPKGSSLRAVTVREARRLVELYGDLPGIYEHISTIKAPTLKKKLKENRKTYEQRFRDNTECKPKKLLELPRCLAWKLEGKRQEALLRRHGFYSLVRMLPLPDKPPEVESTTKTRSSKSYQAVLSCREFSELLERLSHAKLCAVDTEADDKDPRTATLFGISFSIERGEAFFVPYCERDMGDLTPRTVQLGLKKLFKSRTNFVGHNLLYDFMLLHRHGIDPPSICFDTLLAVRDCYGDLDFFNLPFLSQKLLSRKIKAYKDIVGKDKTFMELPFEEMKEHACTDADVALQLQKLVARELKKRKIADQFENRTMPFMLMLLDLEKGGVSVDRKKLEKLRSTLLAEMFSAKKEVSDAIGTEVDLDQEKQISALMKEKLGLREILGRKSLTQSLLEQLAGQQPVLKRVVEYKRSGKQLRRVESIIKAIRRGRVYPLFNQHKYADGRLASTNPDLFVDDGLDRLRVCIGSGLDVWLQNPQRSLGLAQSLSGDTALKKDRAGKGKVNRFMDGQEMIKGLDHDDLLLRILIGESSHRLSTRFLVDRLTINNTIHELEIRYSRLFRYMADFKKQGLKRGYVEREGRRKYFEGFGSSSIEKRHKAQLLACRWLLQY